MITRIQLPQASQRARRRPPSWLVLPLLLVLGALAASAEKIADIRASGYVTDLAGVMAAPATARLNALCAEVERKTGVQVAVVTVRSLEGQGVEEYAVDLFKHLGVGRKDNRGVLLLLAPRERRYRVEVGYGLEPVINDARAGDVGRAMIPALRRGDYSGAIEIGVNQLAQMIAGASKVTLQPQPPVRVLPQRRPEPGFPWWIILPFGLSAIPFFIRMFRPGTRRRPGSGIWWIGPGGFGGGWGGGGGFGGGFGGGSGGFGGFGGGSSGGGGASGSW